VFGYFYFSQTMPLLPAESPLYPDCLFDQPRSGAVDRNWWVLHTRPRQEKALARQLFSSAISYYLPLVSKRLRSKNRTLTSYVPLFSGYVFLLAEKEERIAALATHRVVQSIPVVDQERLWIDLAQIHRLINSGAPITPEGQLTVGTVVEIRSGPLTGLKGKIVRSATGRRFIVEVDFIQRGASVLLDDFALTPVLA
jgi:transcriptional antiterminator RfaH